MTALSCERFVYTRMGKGKGSKYGILTGKQLVAKRASAQKMPAAERIQLIAECKSTAAKCNVLIVTGPFLPENLKEKLFTLYSYANFVDAGGAYVMRTIIKNMETNSKIRGHSFHKKKVLFKLIECLRDSDGKCTCGRKDCDGTTMTFNGLDGIFADRQIDAIGYGDEAQVIEWVNKKHNTHIMARSNPICVLRLWDG
ncbi:hypothetical protein JKP88DRAFT_245886 [Tribonema minus]|uniref:Uncharacterized protein n=1 Tax=Tribonema minus TaxID=303371 RepID=A0A836CD24_9STRA|nr:hypothetical protein JKP88DRAFT_245886 [Tribonema minus]